MVKDVAKEFAEPGQLIIFPSEGDEQALLPGGNRKESGSSTAEPMPRAP